MSDNRTLLFSAPDPDQRASPRPLRIVIADDERDTVMTLMMILKQEGHDTRGAYSGKQLLQVARDFDPDAVILDIALGDASGWEIAQQIHTQSGNRRPMLIGMSGIYKKGVDRILAEMNGLDHYLVKPFDPATLIALLQPLTLPQSGE